MPMYFYKAIKKSGEVYKSSIFATDEDDLKKKVRSQEGVIINYSIKEGWFSFLNNFSLIGFSVSTQDKIIFAKNLSSMIDAGLPVSKSLSTLEKQFKNPKFKQIIQNINSDIKKGDPINIALKKYPNVFSSLFVSMVKAGEESGKIADSLKIVYEQMESSDFLRKKVKGAMIYPIIIVIAMLVIGILMLVFIVPTLQETFIDVGAELPLSTQIVIAFSNFLKNHIILFFNSLIILLAGGFFSSRTRRGKNMIDTVVLKIPIISTIIKEINSARTARTLSSLLSSGVDIVRAFDITEEIIQNHHYKKVLNDAKKNIQGGVPIAEIFVQNEKLYPPIVGAMMEVGEETGKLPKMLLEIASFYEGEVAQKTKNISTIIEPILMVFIGVAVGFFAVSMISPMYSLMNNI